MKILYQGRYSQRDVRRAILLSYPRWYQALALPSLVIAGFILVGGMIVAFWVPESEPLRRLESLLPLALMFVLPAGVLWGRLWVEARRVLKSPLIQGEVSGVATGKALETRNDFAESRVLWSAYIWYKMSDEMVILYQREGAFNMAPRGHFASEDDWKRFQKLVREAVPAKA